MTRVLTIIFLASLCFSSAFAQTSTQKTPTTPKQRANWVKMSHKLEKEPEMPSTQTDAELAALEILGASDFHVIVCPKLFQDLNIRGYKYQNAITALYLLGAATYQVETGKTDSTDTTLYAVHSVLKGYAVIVQQDPKAKNPLLDSIATMDVSGKLLAFLENEPCQ